MRASLKASHGCVFGGNQVEERCPVPVRLQGFVRVPDLIFQDETGRGRRTFEDAVIDVAFGAFFMAHSYQILLICFGKTQAKACGYILYY